MGPSAWVRSCLPGSARCCRGRGKSLLLGPPLLRPWLAWDKCCLQASGSPKKGFLDMPWEATGSASEPSLFGSKACGIICALGAHGRRDLS